jgi:hypothetical protein
MCRPAQFAVDLSPDRGRGAVPADHPWSSPQWKKGGVAGMKEAAASRPPRAVAAGSALWRTIRAYVALTKPRVLELLLVTTVPVMILAQGGCRTCGSCGDGDRRRHERRIGGHLQHVPRSRHRRAHARTEKRPLVTGEVTPRGALVFAWTLAVGSTSGCC